MIAEEERGRRFTQSSDARIEALMRINTTDWLSPAREGNAGAELRVVDTCDLRPVARGACEANPAVRLAGSAAQVSARLPMGRPFVVVGFLQPDAAVEKTQ